MCVLASMETTLSIVSDVVGLLLTGRAETAQVSLDEVAEAIGAAAVTMPEIEAIFDALEAAGHPVEVAPKNPPAALAQVLSTVRSFSAVSGRRPTIAEIARHSGLSLGEVRFALLYARVLVR
jgi:phytoene dehydrogenase-like protein